ncbi:MAG: lambda-exonuclease family protein [Blautia marasmi]
MGGSDVAAIFGVSPWTTPLELWKIKKGQMKPAKKNNANQLQMGHLLEPIAAYWYGAKTGNTVIEDTNLYQHADHPYALANIDRRFIRASDREPGILECKSCTYHKAAEWADGAIPLYYELQLRFYLAVADVNIGAFSAVWETIRTMIWQCQRLFVIRRKRI